MQEHDTTLDQLRHRRSTLPQRAALADLAAQASALAARTAEVTGERDGLEARRATLEADVAVLERRLVELDKRLRSGAVTATRELTAMVEQSEALKRRRAELEDVELELMVTIDPLDTELTDLGARLAMVAASRAATELALAGAEAGIDAELEKVAAARVDAAASVPEALVPTYERLRARLGGIGVARLVGSSCGGCHLALSATEIDRIRHEALDALVTCDQCGRILVR